MKNIMKLCQNINYSHFQKAKNLVPQAILIFIGDYDIVLEDTDEAWRLFVQELSRIGENDFSKLLEIDLNHEE